MNTISVYFINVSFCYRNDAANDDKQASDELCKQVSM